jgi:hypothetical protein
VVITKYNRAEIRTALSHKPVFKREEILNLFYSRYKITASHAQWAVFDLCRDKVIRRVARNIYTLYKKEEDLPVYESDDSDETVEIRRFLEEKYPMLDFAVWEMRALNEFLNHQIERNHVFVEVEKPLEESIFLALREKVKYPVLYKPTAKEVSLYSGPLTVLVIPLTTEAPVHGHEVTLEKLLVDLFANPILSCIISKNEYTDIFEEAQSRYTINRNSLLRYAKRRGKAEEVQKRIPYD